MKSYKVRAIHPISNQPVLFMDVPQSQLHQNDSGETRMFFNRHYPSVEVVSVVELSQEYHNSVTSYFNQFGTAAE